MAIEKVVKYGILVFSDIEGEAIRNKICLCLHCARLVTQEDVESLVISDTTSIHNLQQATYERQMRIEELTAAYNCPVAQSNYANCVAGGVAAPIVRCPMYQPKERSEE